MRRRVSSKSLKISFMKLPTSLEWADGFMANGLRMIFARFIGHRCGVIRGRCMECFINVRSGEVAELFKRLESLDPRASRRDVGALRNNCRRRYATVCAHASLRPPAEICWNLSGLRQCLFSLGRAL